ncbi:hypothetical protein EXIGLDRAFT_721343 [Exidia glandulosa HHB12029]|uniref:Hydantoin racemase n=1 Tax=Exidia glandulosa HHB12029 TaxID=1314781 RepID=A0A165ND70_EXIGL|nr:hypothetical protein EXIGLDRAFT_721343 [Exidia glandulosa HHB12029]
MSKDDQIHILVINPNSSQEMTADVERATSSVRLPPDVQLAFATAPSPAPASINSLADGVLSAAAVFNSTVLVNAGHVPDAIVVACFSPHPLVQMYRETLRTVVVGIYEAAVQTAIQHGRFGIVTTGEYWETVLYDALESSAGICKERCVGVRGTNVAVLDLNSESHHGAGNETRAAMLNASLELLRKGANAIVLGCAGMAPLAKQLQDDLLTAEPWRAGLKTQRVPVVDGVRAAIEIAASLVRQTHV